MTNPFTLSPTASPFATRPYPVLSHKEVGQSPDGLAFNTNTASLYAPTSLAASTANSNAQFDYTNYAPSYIDKSRTNILTDNSQANATNNLQLKYVVKAPQKTNIYYDGQSNIINNNSNTYYYIAAATPPQQPSYETPLYYPTQGGYYPTNSHYPPVGNDYSGGHATAGYNGYGYGYPPQQQDNHWVNILLSVLLPLLQPKQEPHYNRTPDIINLTIKNELKDLVNLVNENKNVAKADSESVIDNNDYEFDIDQSQHETTSYHEAKEKAHPKAKKTHLSESGPSKKSTASRTPLW
jgi:hypothetical protein